MTASLKSELRKIYTARSTYVTLLFCLVIMCIYAFWAEGIKAGDSTKPASDPYKVASLIRDAIIALSFFGSLVGVLSLTNEYRYNLITYTLTASNSRTKSLFAKIVAVSLFSVFFALFVSLFAPALMLLGISIKGFVLGHQIFPLDLIWRILFVTWSYSMIGLLLASLIRHQTGVIATFFATPLFIEQLISLALKDNRIYLPFNLISQVATSESFANALSHAKAATTLTAYLIVGWAIAWYLFLKRDAT